MSFVLLVFGRMWAFTMRIHIGAGSKRFRTKCARVQIRSATMYGHVFLYVKYDNFLDKPNELYMFIHSIHSPSHTFNVFVRLNILSQIVHRYAGSPCTVRMWARNAFLFAEIRPQNWHFSLEAECRRICSFRPYSCFSHFLHNSHRTFCWIFVCTDM